MRYGQAQSAFKLVAFYRRQGGVLTPPKQRCIDEIEYQAHKK